VQPVCGISGLIELDATRRGDVEQNTAAMAATLEHRGPDDSGLWIDPAFPIGLGFRRLAVIDVSDTGHQPMTSPDDRWVLVFNGEIYNYRDLRARLPGGYPWRGQSDTEVLLAALTTWGVPETLRRVDGMFALALWDRQERRLTLARDRFGEKPLYYGWVDQSFVFGSELKALHAHPGFCPSVDRASVALFLRHDYIAAPWSIYQDVRKLPPASHLDVEVGARGRPEPREYWTARDVAEAALADPFRGTAVQAADELERCLSDSIAGRTVADVPLGAFLSGGIDSSSVVALLQHRSTRPVQTFAIGFPGTDYDEAPWAAKVAAHLGTVHTEVAMTSADVLGIIPDLPDMYDEPFADASQVPTHLVSRVARAQVTVALSGDGGDELFGGYNRYTGLDGLWRRLQRVPRFMRPSAARSLTRVPEARWDAMGRLLTPVLPPGLRFAHLGSKVHKLAATLECSSADEVYLNLVSRWRDTSVLLPGVLEHPTALTSSTAALADGSLVKRMMHLDTLTYLPDDILTKVDRAAMATSLETRVPMLSPEVFALAWRLPVELKVSGGQGKQVLRDVLARHVPRELVERPKMGFTMPLGSWLRHELRPWAEDLLAPDRLRAQGLFDPDPIQTVLRQHMAGTHDWKDHLWGPLMFQAWWERWHG